MESQLGRSRLRDKDFIAFNYLDHHSIAATIRPVDRLYLTLLHASSSDNNLCSQCNEPQWLRSCCLVQLCPDTEWKRATTWSKPCFVIHRSYLCPSMMAVWQAAMNVLCSARFHQAYFSLSSHRRRHHLQTRLVNKLRKEGRKSKNSEIENVAWVVYGVLLYKYLIHWKIHVGRRLATTGGCSDWVVSMRFVSRTMQAFGNDFSMVTTQFVGVDRNAQIAA